MLPCPEFHSRSDQRPPPQYTLLPPSVHTSCSASFLWLFVLGGRTSAPPKCVPAFAEHLGVCLQATDELCVRRTLLSHDAAQALLIALPRLPMVLEQPLVLFHEIPNDPDAEDSNDDQAGNKQPAVIHSGRMVNSFKKFLSTHIFGFANSSPVSQRRRLYQSASHTSTASPGSPSTTHALC